MIASMIEVYYNMYMAVLSICFVIGMLPLCVNIHLNKSLVLPLNKSKMRQAQLYIA